MGKAIRISVSLILAAGMLVCFCFFDVSSTSGAEGNSVTVKKGSITEREMMQNLQSKSASQLRKMGYTDKQIKTIKNCEPKALTGKVSYWIKYRNFKSVKVKAKNKKRKYWITKITTVAKWKWVRPPFFAFKDMYGVTTSDRFVKERTWGSVVYHQKGDRRLKKRTVNLRVKTNNTGRGVYLKFPVGRSFKLQERYKWGCTDGVITTRWIANGKINVVGLASNYGHSVLELNPRISFSVGASISYHPYISMEYGDEAFVRARK